MKKQTKSWIALIIVTILCLGTIIPAVAGINIPEATSDFYVNDFANVFSEEEKDKLITNALVLANEHDGVQVVVTTIKSLDGQTIEDYAYDMYNKYGIGKDDMGLLILLATEDRKIRVEVGAAMEAYVNDSKAGRFIDNYAISYLKENKFDEGLISLQEALITEVKDKVVQDNQSQKDDSSIKIDWSSVLWVIGVILGVGLIGLGITVAVKKVKEKREYVENLKAENKKLKENEDSLRKKHIKELCDLKIATISLEREKTNLSQEVINLNRNLEHIKDRYNRILTIYPDADSKVDAQIQEELIEKDKEEAASVDSLISSVICNIPSRTNVDELQNALSRYSNLSSNQQKYVKSDVAKLKQLYSDSLKLKEEYERKLEQERVQRLKEQRQNKANSITKEILGVVAVVGIAKANDLSRLKNAMALYDDLDSETKKYVDRTVISKLESLLYDAKKDKQNRDEEERRRRSNYSSSSFRSNPSTFRGGGYDGFGGGTRGGGASRGF